MPPFRRLLQAWWLISWLEVENFSQRMGEAADPPCRSARSAGRPGQAGCLNARDVRLHAHPRSRKRICARQGFAAPI
jgi:hypothetical protein